MKCGLAIVNTNTFNISLRNSIYVCTYRTLHIYIDGHAYIIHKCIHTYIYTYIHACIHTYTHTYTHAHTYIHTYTYIQIKNFDKIE